MDIGSLFLILALLILVALFISRPLFDRQFTTAGRPADQEDHEISALLAERDRILNALQELDFDHALGKIPEEDYPAQRITLLQNGADILRRLDHYQGQDRAQAGAGNGDEEARIEAVIAARSAGARRADARRRSEPESERQVARQQGRVADAALTADDDLEVLLANRRRVRKEKLAGFCPQCGSPVQQSDHFCPKCGEKLT